MAFVLRTIIKGITKGFRFVGRGFTKVNTKVKEVNERLDELAQEVLHSVPFIPLSPFIRFKVILR
jgi:uncharacterized protein YaaR (DUF327 family)